MSLTFDISPSRVFGKLVKTVEPATLFAKIGLINVLPDAWYSEGLKVNSRVGTLSGQMVEVTKGPKGEVILNDKVTLVTPDFTTSSGVFHEVDNLL